MSPPGPSGPGGPATDAGADRGPAGMEREGPPTWWGPGPARPVMAAFLGLQSTHALSSNAADALFFSRFGVVHLPVLYIVLGLATMAALLGYTAALMRLGRRTVYLGVLAVGAAGMATLRLLVASGERWVLAVVWVVANVFILVTLALMWNLAGNTVDARSAKRWYPLFAGAGVLGGVIGNVATGPLVALIGTPNLLVLTAAIYVLAAAAIARVAFGPEPEFREPVLARLAADVGLGVRSPLLRLVAVAMALATTLFYLVAFPFSEAVAASFDREADIATFLGLFSAGATAATLLMAMLVANRLLARLGVLTAWFLVAVTYVAGFTIWLATLSLATASLFRLAQWVMASTIGETARSAVFNALRADRRGEVMAAFAAIPTQLGVVGAGVMLLALRRADDRAGSAVGLLLAAALAGAIWRMRRHYSAALVDALREGVSIAFTSPHRGFSSMATDADATSTLLAGTVDDRPEIRRLSAEIIGRAELVDGLPALTTLLDDEDLSVRLAAFDGLDHIGDRSGQAGRPWADRVLSALFPADGSFAGLEAATPDERARVTRWLVKAGELSTADRLLTGMLSSDDSGERTAALHAVTDMKWAPDRGDIARLLVDDPSIVVRSAASAATAVLAGAGDELYRGLLDQDPTVRSAAAEAWRDADGEPEPVLALLEQERPELWEAAIVALGHRAAQVGDRVSTWATRRVVDAAMVRAQHGVISLFADDPAMPASAYLAALLQQRVAMSTRVALRILALLEPEETAHLIIDGLSSEDPDARAQALEAAEAIGGRLAHQVVPILDGSTVGPESIRTAIAQLSGDPDPWIRMLAFRSATELAARDWADGLASASRDPDRRVRDTAGHVATRLEPTMGETLDTVGRLDRMLMLRRVPIFESLLPEDLERVAEVAVEQTFAAGELLFAAGDPSQDLLLVLDGDVDLVAEGQPLVERLGPGNHIGELAALCGQPRTTDARASGRVRVLSIEAGVLNRLLDDRPDVMRQMLSDLAARLTNHLRQADTASAQVQKLY